MQPALRELLLRGEGAGELQGAGIGRSEHPVCGDEVILHVRVQDGRVAELRWQAHACPASTALAALAAKVLPGVAVVDCAATFRQQIVAHGGLAAHERHAEALLLRAFATAVGES